MIRRYYLLFFVLSIGPLGFGMETLDELKSRSATELLCEFGLADSPQKNKEEKSPAIDRDITECQHYHEMYDGADRLQPEHREYNIDENDFPFDNARLEYIMRKLEAISACEAVDYDADDEDDDDDTEPGSSNAFENGFPLKYARAQKRARDESKDRLYRPIYRAVIKKHYLSNRFVPARR